MYLYWEHTVIENYYCIKYTRYVANVAIREFLNSFRKLVGAQAAIAKINFQEELFTF